MIYLQEWKFSGVSYVRYGINAGLSAVVYKELIKLKMYYKYMIYIATQYNNYDKKIHSIKLYKNANEAKEACDKHLIKTGKFKFLTDELKLLI